MFKYISTITILILTSTIGVAQLNYSIDTGINLWSLKHNYENVSHPMTPSFQLGINIDFPFVQKALRSGIEFRIAPSTEAYVTKVGNEDVLALLYEQIISDSFTANSHYELAVPLVYCFQISQLANSVGFEYDYLRFNPENNFSPSHHTVGFRIETGIQANSHIALKAGFYQSLFSTMKMEVNILDSPTASSLDAGLQRLYFTLSYSPKPKKTPEPFIIKYKTK